MKHLGIAIMFAASFCCAQALEEFQPSTTNVWGAEYPRVDASGRVQIRVKAPDATKVKLNFWSGPKVEMEKQPDGFWSVTTPPLVPGLHYYTLIIDGAEVSDQHACVFRWDQGGECGRGSGNGFYVLFDSRCAPRPGAGSLVSLESHGQLAARARLSTTKLRS